MEISINNKIYKVKKCPKCKKYPKFEIDFDYNNYLWLHLFCEEKCIEFSEPLNPQCVWDVIKTSINWWNLKVEK